VIVYYLHLRFILLFIEYSSIIWSPYFKNEINKIKAGQRFFTKAIGNLRSLRYSDRLNYLNLDSLQCRRVKDDMIVKYYIVWLLILSLHVFKRSLYPWAWFFQYSCYYLLIYGIRCLTILLRLDLSQHYWIWIFSLSIVLIISYHQFKEAF